MVRILLLVALLSTASQAWAEDTRFSTLLAAKFQSKACTNCHDFFEKSRNGRAFGTHKGRTPAECTDCHDSSTTGFKDEDEWFARSGLFTSAMDSKKTCQAVMTAQQAQFKSKSLLARQLEKHLLEDPRVLWAIDGATPQSGQLPEGKRATGLVAGGFAEWKTQVLAWIKGGMTCD